jgi:hypothetical protein
MRITDERYHRDRLRYDLALRMIRHEARTCTIRCFTDLTDDRIRKLFKAYVEFESPQPVRRHRGKSPRQPGYFLRNIATQLESTLLAGIFGSFGLLAAARRDGGHRGLEFGTRFCDAYDAYRFFSPSPALSFEHAWLLLKALARDEEICLAHCPRCFAPYLRDVYALEPRNCPLCRVKRRAPASQRVGPRRPPADRPRVRVAPALRPPPPAGGPLPAG